MHPCFTSKPMRFIAAGAILFGVYLLFSLKAIHEPLLGDSISLPLCAERLARGEAFTAVHPALYINLLNIPIGMGMHSAEGYRLVGIAGFLLTLILILLVAHRLTGEHLPGVLAAALYAINPMAIKGSLLTDIDTTVLPPLLLAFIWLVLKFREHAGLRPYVALSVCLTVLLWAKLPTPFLLVTALMLFHLLRKDFRGMAGTFAVGATALVLFLATWFSYPHLIRSTFSPANIFTGNTGAFLTTNVFANGGGLSVLARSVLLIMLWASPGLVALFFIAAVRKARDNGGASFLALYAGLVFAVYTLGSSVCFAFPKYLYPWISAACILTALLITPLAREMTRREIIVCAGVTVVFVLSLTGIVGDPLYLATAYLKEILVNDPASKMSAIRLVSIKLMLFFISIPVIFAVLRVLSPKRTWSQVLVMCLLVSTVAANISLDIIQLRAPYLTVYCYGGRVPASFPAYLREQLASGKTLLAPPDIMFAAGRPVNVPAPSKFWDDPAALLQRMNDGRIDCLAYGFSSNTLYQYEHTFHDGNLLRFLNDHYSSREFGSYTVWTKKSDR